MNTEKRLQVVSFEQAKRLKAAGFYWEYFDSVYSDDGELVSVPFADVYETPAPTVALALKWARDVKQIFGVICLYDNGDRLLFWFALKDAKGENTEVPLDAPTYEQAESAMLDAVLDEIEKEGG